MNSQESEITQLLLAWADGMFTGWMRTRLASIAICARAMRRIPVDAARKRATAKHGGCLGRIGLDEIDGLSDRKNRDFLALNDALDQLQESGSFYRNWFSGYGTAVGIARREVAAALARSVPTPPNVQLPAA